MFSVAFALQAWVAAHTCSDPCPPDLCRSLGNVLCHLLFVDTVFSAVSVHCDLPKPLAASLPRESPEASPMSLFLSCNLRHILGQGAKPLWVLPPLSCLPETDFFIASCPVLSKLLFDTFWLLAVLVTITDLIPVPQDSVDAKVSRH